MKSLVTIPLLFLLLSSAALAKEEPVSVSMIELISTPEKFDGKLVNVIGFLTMGERTSLSIHREDAEHLLPNGINVIPTQEMGREKEKLNGMYVVIVGVFRAVPGVGGRPARVITDIRQYRIWSNPSRPLAVYPNGKWLVEPKKR